MATELLKTSLHKEHLYLKAKMAPFAGFDMPLQYSSIREEVSAVRNKVGVFDVSHMGEFFIEGPEAIKFVDYMITNDFSSPELHKAVYSPLCKENGTVLDDLIAYKLRENRVLICVNASNIDKDFNWFKEHCDQFNCTLTNQSQTYDLLALQGPQSEKILKELEILPSTDFPYYCAKELSTPLGSLILARTGYTGEDGFEIFAKKEVISSLWAKLIHSGVTPCGLASRDILRLEVGYPLYGHELSDQWTPLDSGLKWTVKLQKENDFIGKTALNEYKPKLRLVKLSLEKGKGIPRDGLEVLNEKEEVIGKITSGTMSLTLGKGIAMALIQRDLFPENKKFKIKIRRNILEANYHTKAFIAGGHKS